MEERRSSEAGGAATPADPAIAVVVACYNYEQYVASAIESVLSQECARCELVVVDDGSTDSSWEVVSRYPVRKFRIENRGQREACVHGLDNTRAPFVLFLDADDVLLPGSLDRLVAVLEPSIAKVQFSLTRIDGDGAPIEGLRTRLEDGRERETLRRSTLESGVYETPPTSGNVFRRDVAEIVRGADYDRYVDGVSLFAAPFFGDVVSIAEPLGAYRVHDANISAIGSLPTPENSERDMKMFSDRMGHLRRIVAEREPGVEVPDPQEFYLYRAMEQTHALASGRSPPFSGLWGLLGALMTEGGRTFGKKLELGGFAIAATMLPQRSARALMNYRYKSGARSLKGALARVFRPGRHLQA